MHQDDRPIGQLALNALNNRSRGGLRLPIKRVDGPVHRAIAQVCRELPHMLIPRPKGWTEVRTSCPACDTRDDLLSLCQFIAYRSICERRQVGMRHRMVADLIATVCDMAHNVRVLLCPATREKPGGVNTAPVQNVQYLWCWRNFSTSVKGQRDLRFTRIATVNFCCQDGCHARWRITGSRPWRRCLCWR